MPRLLPTVMIFAVVALTAAPPRASGAEPDRVAGGKTARHADEGETEKQSVLREGETYEGVGRFVETGDRYMFYPADSSAPFRILENLALERVARVLDNAHQRVEPTWTVKGVVYEFRGTNYLLVRRAVVKGRTR